MRDKDNLHTYLSLMKMRLSKLSLEIHKETETIDALINILNSSIVDKKENENEIPRR